MPLFGPPNIEKLKERRDVKGLLRAALDDNDSVRRRKAAEALGELGDAWAVEFLITALKDEVLAVRWRAAEALGMLRDARALWPLIAALEDVFVSEHAQVALKQLHAVELLTAALKAPDGFVRGQAAEALRKLAFLRATGRVKVDWGEAQAVEPLIAALKDEEPLVRAQAAWTLGLLGDARAVEPLIAALTDESPFVRERVEWGLADFHVPEAKRALAEYRAREK